MNSNDYLYWDNKKLLEDNAKYMKDIHKLKYSLKNEKRKVW